MEVCGALRARLLDTASGFGKAYLNLLVDEIRLDGKGRPIGWWLSITQPDADGDVSFVGSGYATSTFTG